MNRKKLAWCGLGLAAYLALLGCLTLAESACPNGSIQTFGDALWYSLITLTTVGYGDLYPVSPLGRVIGAVLALMSMGVLAALIGAAVSLFTGRLLPGLALFVCRGKSWFLFSEYNAAAQTLAEDLAREQPRSLRIFCGAQRGHYQRPGCLFVKESPSELMARPGLKGGARHVFFIKADPLANMKEAQPMTGQPVYCLGPENPRLKNVTFFDPYECCARRYWQAHPLALHENCLIIAGSGHYAQALLENALLSQSRQPFASCEYHLFGDWSRWRSLHPALTQALGVNEYRPGADSLWFHDESWFAHQPLMAKASRIILCHDQEAENLMEALDHARLFGGQQPLFVRAGGGAVPGISFGDAKDIYTAQLVMKQALDARARRMHDLYRAQSPAAPAWEELPPFLKASNRAAADHLPMKKQLLAGEKYAALSPEMREKMRRCEHDRWLRFYSLYNWRLGDEKDGASRRHPCLKPYEQLSAADQAKDDYAWQLMEECE